MTVRLTSRAERDLRKLDARQRTAVVDALRRLDQGAAKVDVKALRGTPGWLRLRIGDYRALFRPIEGDWLVDRIVDRRELDRGPVAELVPLARPVWSTGPAMERVVREASADAGLLRDLADVRQQTVEER